MDLGLSGKRVVVTGASRGIGQAVARRFLEEGAHVTIVSRGSPQLYATREKLAEIFGEASVVAETCDCSNTEALELLQKNVVKRSSHLDILIANVGDGRSVPDIVPSESQWEGTWRNNFDCAIKTARAFLPMLQESKGCLLFVSSITGLEALGAPVDYSTAKAAVTALAKNMARKLATEVRVNVVAPGNIVFDDSSWDQKLKIDKEQVDEFINSNVPMKRFGLPEEVADAIVFLCSERATFITGSVLTIDGGQTVGIF